MNARHTSIVSARLETIRARRRHVEHLAYMKQCVADLSQQPSFVAELRISPKQWAWLRKLRDEFAMRVLPAVVAAVSAGRHQAGAASNTDLDASLTTEDRIASDTYLLADAMMKVRSL